MAQQESGDRDTDLLDALRVENETLRQRVEQLSAEADEYRRQMAAVLTSASWRLVAPVRGLASKARLYRRRLRRLSRRLTMSEASHRGRATAGLFPPAAPPPGSLATPHSPLLGRPHRATRVAVAGSPRIAPNGRLLVAAHVYYPEVWPDIEDRLARMPEAYDMIVTLVRGRAESLEQRIKARFPWARLHHRDNFGRDLGSLVELANLGVFDGYDAVLKVHTKRSPHRVDGDAWRVALLDGVMPSPDGIARMVALLREDRNVGLIAPGGHVRGAETWGSDRELVEALAARLPIAFDPEGLRYPAGSMYWARPWVLQRLADLAISREHFESEADHLDGSTAHALERFVGVVAAASGLDLVETDDVASRLHRARRTKRERPRTFAFYLPQYHRSADNDRWWGPGFTDWRSVDAAKPLYDGHDQPVTPGELGRYDLADPGVMRRQAALATEYGIDGFVMYHYWFDGRRLLDVPLRNLLADPSIDFPFALCWANENWTRRWDGLDDDVLIRQSYQPGWADRFYDDIAPALADPRYLRVDGRPILVVYRLGQVPDAREAIATWRRRAAADGLGDLHLLAVTALRDFEAIPKDVLAAVDGLVRFPPGSAVGLHSVRSLAPSLSGEHTGDIYSYDYAVDGADLDTKGPAGLTIHPGVMPGWDNTPRRGSAAYVFHSGNPLSFRRWLARAADAAATTPDRLLFVNAWNEWAEGAHLEPDGRFGRGNLEAVRDVVGTAQRRPALVAAPELVTDAVSVAGPQPDVDVRSMVI